MKTENVSIKRALLSVSDKTHLKELVSFLFENKVEMISTGGTKKFIEELGFPVKSVESITGNPEAFGGRMKSISFQMSSALLFRRYHEVDLKEAQKLNIQPIDLVVCNLYPFEKVAAESQSTEDELIENIDIGGPLMVRASAKNYESVTVLSDVSDYQNFMNHFISQKAQVSFNFRRTQALKTFERIAWYDLAIASELQQRFAPEDERLRYGENPHQKAALIKVQNSSLNKNYLAQAEFLQGKALSYNNWLDADAAWRVMSDVHHLDSTQFVTSVIKHSNPCGLVASTSSFVSLVEAWHGDAISSFGSIIATNYRIEEEHVDFLLQYFIEVLIAPEFSPLAVEKLKNKKNIRVLKQNVRPFEQTEKMVRQVSGGLLIQDEDDFSHSKDQNKLVTTQNFSMSTEKIVPFGIRACKHLKSNGIALVSELESEYKNMKHKSLLLAAGGMGQTNRLDSLRLLAVYRVKQKQGDDLSSQVQGYKRVNQAFDFKNLVLISDAFFPFADSIDVCAELGLKNIVQPGGSIKDQEVIAACEKYKMAMVFTGIRHFRH